MKPSPFGLVNHAADAGEAQPGWHYKKELRIATEGMCMCTAAPKTTWCEEQPANPTPHIDICVTTWWRTNLWCWWFAGQELVAYWDILGLGGPVQVMQRPAHFTDLRQLHVEQLPPGWVLRQWHLQEPEQGTIASLLHTVLYSSYEEGMRHAKQMCCCAAQSCQVQRDRPGAGLPHTLNLRAV